MAQKSFRPAAMARRKRVPITAGEGRGRSGVAGLGRLLRGAAGAGLREAVACDCRMETAGERARRPRSARAPGLRLTACERDGRGRRSETCAGRSRPCERDGRGRRSDGSRPRRRGRGRRSDGLSRPARRRRRPHERDDLGRHEHRGLGQSHGRGSRAGARLDASTHRADGLAARGSDDAAVMTLDVTAAARGVRRGTVVEPDDGRRFDSRGWSRGQVVRRGRRRS